MSHLFEHLTILPKKIIQVHWEKVIYLTSVFQMAPPAQSKSPPPVHKGKHENSVPGFYVGIKNSNELGV